MFYQEYDFLNDASDNEGDGDFDGNESSDDDDLRRVLRDIADVKEDEDFEASMERDLNDTVRSLEAERLSESSHPLSIAPGPLLALPEASSTLSTDAKTATAVSSNDAKPSKKGKAVKFAEEPAKYYDDDYFDSDDDEEAKTGATGSGERKKHPVPTNDDLFYDPNLDDHDQAWVDKQRDKYQPKSNPLETKLPTKKTRKPKEKGLPTSDAVLNCPACMTTLCLDCQRHEIYHQQYRAMFVKNCSVDTSQSLKHKMKSPSTKKRRNAQGEALDTDEDLYNPVKCSECGTEVAVYDKDEVYHFFNVLASHA